MCENNLLFDSKDIDTKLGVYYLSGGGGTNVQVETRLIS